MAKRREGNYDLLRVISTFMVVMLHTSGGFLKIDESGVPMNPSLSVMVFNTLTRFAVPCFFMLSGAFLLADERNADFSYFYRKSWKSIGITGAAFCALYFLYALAVPTLTTLVLGKRDAGELPGIALGVVKSTIEGTPYYHLWYLFVLLGCYAAVPLVIRMAGSLHGGY